MSQNLIMERIKKQNKSKLGTIQRIDQFADLELREG